MFDNIIDKKRMLEGLLYNLSVDLDTTEAEMDALIAARDLMRNAGLVCSADKFGRIVVRRRESGRQAAIGLFI